MPGGAESTLKSDSPKGLAPLRMTVDLPEPIAPTTAIVIGFELSARGLGCRAFRDWAQLANK